MSKRSYNLTGVQESNAVMTYFPEGKKRRSHTGLDCILDAGRLIIRGGKQSATMTEDRLFRQFFGCGAIVALALWNLLMADTQIASDVSIEHMMWALLFLKTYSRESVLVRMLGRPVDEKTFRESMWTMVDAIATLEPTVVSCQVCMIYDAMYNSCFLLTSLLLLCCRLTGIIDLLEILAMIVWCQLMGPISRFLSMVETSSAIKIRNLAFDMRFLFAYCQVT